MSNASSRADALSWILHLVGDIHQPLHLVALKTNEFPEGDSGGNAFCIRPGAGNYTAPLHSYWDNLLKASSKDIVTAENCRMQLN